MRAPLNRAKALEANVSGTYFRWDNLDVFVWDNLDVFVDVAGGRTKAPSPGSSPCSANAIDASNASATGAAIIKSLEGMATSRVTGRSPLCCAP